MSTPEAHNKEPKNKNDKGERKRMKLPEHMPVGPGNFWNNVLSTVLLLIALTFLYSYFSDAQNPPEEISVSDIAERVRNGEVKSITVKGTELHVAYQDETRTESISKKENDAAITETLTNLGVTTEQMNGVKIAVENESGFSYWLSNLAPFLFPLILLGFIIWFFTRSVRGAGMQAMSFGSSKARVIYPDDTTQCKGSEAGARRNC
jgi:cell division protease FtsH